MRFTGFLFLLLPWVCVAVLRLSRATSLAINQDSEAPGLPRAPGRTKSALIIILEEIRRAKKKRMRVFLK